MAMMTKFLGGVGKAAGKAANLADDVGATVKNVAKNASDAVADGAHVMSDTYRATRMESAKVASEMEEGIRDATGKKIKKTPKVKEAKAPSNESKDVVSEAITHTKRQVNGSKKNSDIRYTQKDGKYYRQAGTQEPIELTESQYKMHLEGQDKELAEQLSQTADSWSLGDIKNWAEENQGLATTIAVGGGMAAGGLLFGGDDN